MSHDDLREGLEAGIGRVQDGLDPVFAGDWIKKSRSCACKFVCGAQDALSDLVVDRPVLFVTIAVLFGVVLGRMMARRR